MGREIGRTISSRAGRAAARTRGRCGARSPPEGIPARTYRTVARLSGYLRERQRSGEALPRVAAGRIGMTPAQAAGLGVVRLEQRATEEQRALKQPGAPHPAIQTALALFASVATLVRERSGSQSTCRLEQWMAQAKWSIRQ